jgi:hypothetical protein
MTIRPTIAGRIRNKGDTGPPYMVTRKGRDADDAGPAHLYRRHHTQQRKDKP